MASTDRRVQRTRDLLQKALVELIREQRYDAITIQDIAARANVGRSTFYQHYSTKDELFIACHEAIVGEFRPGQLFPHPLSREELLSTETPRGMIAAYRHLQATWGRLSPVFEGKDGQHILRRIRDQSAQQIEANLRACFVNEQSAVPLEVLANYLAGAQLALVQWWLEKRRPHTAETIALMFHRLQRAAICDAFGLSVTPQMRGYEANR